MRRAGALVVVALVAFGLFRGASALLSSGDDAVAGADATPAAGASTEGASEGGEGAATGGTIGSVVGDATGAVDSGGTLPEVDPPADTEPVNTGPATAQDPATVFIVGDSDAGTFGPYLQTLLDGTGVVETELDYKVSSGLARPDFFDWPAEIDASCPRSTPTSSW